MLVVVRPCLSCTCRIRSTADLVQATTVLISHNVFINWFSKFNSPTKPSTYCLS